MAQQQPYDRTPELLIGSSRADTERNLNGSLGSRPRSSPPMYPQIPTL